eukprot:7182419-Prymnesium_polylepis.1
MIIVERLRGGGEEEPRAQATRDGADTHETHGREAGVTSDQGDAVHALASVERTCSMLAALFHKHHRAPRSAHDHTTRTRSSLNSYAHPLIGGRLTRREARAFPGEAPA